MKCLLGFEVKKVWSGVWYWLPITLAAILVLYSLVSMNLIQTAFDGTARQVNHEFRPYWGQTMTEELRSIAYSQVISYGAEEIKEDWGDGTVFSYFIYDGVQEKYGNNSPEKIACMEWVNLYTQPLLEEEKAGYTPRSNLERKYGTSAWQVAPLFSVWKYFLPFDSFESMLTGLAAIVLILVVTGGIFTHQEAGGLREVSLSTQKSHLWIGAKILVAGLSGCFIALALYLGLFLYQGLLFGFQGWNIGSLSLVAGGYCYGLLVREATALELTLLKFLLIGIGGAFLGLLSAALGVLLRNALAAAGAASGICVLMQIPLYILPSLEYKWMFDPIYRKIPWDAVRTLAITPVRIFFNSEYLTRMWYMESQMNNTNFFNMMLDPQSFTLFFLPIFVSMALCVWICTMYKRLS